jgi:Skp family chaperone for outer membrane proteins
MSWNKRRSLGILAVAGVLLGTMFAVDAFGARSIFARPTSIATIQIERVLNQLNERAEAEGELGARAASLEEERTSRQVVIDELMETYKAAEDLQVRRDLEDQIALKSREMKDWVEFRRAEIDLEKALMIEGLYRAVRSASAEMAQAQGYDIVMIDDSEREFQVTPDNRVPREAQVRTQLFDRRLLYTADIVDATDDLVERMNNAFNAGN